MMTSSIGELVVGIEAERIGSVLDLAEVKDREELLDIACIWGVEPPDDEGRRVLEIRTASGTQQLLVGEMLQLQTVEPRELCRLPKLIEDAVRDTGILSFFVVESDPQDPGGSRLGFVVDVELLSGERK